MNMIFPFAVLLLTSLSVLVSPATVNKRGPSAVSDILDNITELMADVADLDTAVNAIPTTGSDFSSVTTALVNGLTTALTLSQVTTAVENLGIVVDPTNAATILEQMTILQKQAVLIIGAVVTRRNTVERALSGTGFFILNNFKNLINAMITALENVAPPEISRETIRTLQAAVDDALTAALTAFPSCDSLISIGLRSLKSRD